MGDYNDFGEYNGDTRHDMWVDYTSEQYSCGGMSCYDYAENIGPGTPLTRKQIEHRINTPAKSYSESMFRAMCIREQIRRYNQRISSLNRSVERITSKTKITNYQRRISETIVEIENLRQQLSEEEQNSKNIKSRNIKLSMLVFVILCAGLLILAYLSAFSSADNGCT